MVEMTNLAEYLNTSKPLVGWDEVDASPTGQFVENPNPYALVVRPFTFQVREPATNRPLRLELIDTQVLRDPSDPSVVIWMTEIKVIKN